MRGDSIEFPSFWPWKETVPSISPIQMQLNDLNLIFTFSRAINLLLWFLNFWILLHPLTVQKKWFLGRFFLFLKFIRHIPPLQSNLEDLNLAYRFSKDSKCTFQWLQLFTPQVSSVTRKETLFMPVLVSYTHDCESWASHDYHNHTWNIFQSGFIIMYVCVH